MDVQVGRTNITFSAGVRTVIDPTNPGLPRLHERQAVSEVHISSEKIGGILLVIGWARTGDNHGGVRWLSYCLGRG